MKVCDLIEMLSDYDPECEVRIAIQPNYPMEYSIDSVISTDDVKDDEDYANEDCKEQSDVVEELPIVYLTEGQWISYSRKDLWQ